MNVRGRETGAQRGTERTPMAPEKPRFGFGGNGRRRSAVSVRPNGGRRRTEERGVTDEDRE